MITSTECDELIEKFLHRKQLEYPELAMPIEKLYKHVIKEEKLSSRQSVINFSNKYVYIRPKLNSNRFGMAG